MDLTTWHYAFSIFEIALINVALSGDNAVVIALAAHHLPARQRRRVILWGGALAVSMQAGFTLVIARLLHVPGLRVAGALLLLVIAAKLVQEEAAAEAGDAGGGRAAAGAGASIVRIALANLAMSFDNVLAVASVSQSDPIRMGLGLIISGLILFACSAAIVALMARFRWIAYAGALMLALTAAGMIWHEMSPAPGRSASRVAAVVATLGTGGSSPG